VLANNLWAMRARLRRRTLVQSLGGKHAGSNSALGRGMQNARLAQNPQNDEICHVLSTKAEKRS
jgi:hypothetical protein